jgi:protein TonB
MSHYLPAYRVYELPWSSGEEQDRRFLITLRKSAIVVLVLSLALSFLPVPEPDPFEAEEIPERFARFVLEEPVPPPPPVVVEEEEPEPVAEAEPEPAPEPVVEEVVNEAPEPAVVPEPVPLPDPEPAPVDPTQQARERASVAGLLPFAAELQTLRENPNVDRLDRTEIGAVADTVAPVAERSLITSRVGTSSGGIDTAGLSRNTGGAGLAGRAVTQVESSVAGLGDGGGAVRRGGESNLGSRSREEIERVFDRNKGAIYALYNRALREDPTLQGKLVLRLTIAPDGSVTACEVVSSELGDPDLEAKLVQRVLLFQFEPKDVEAVTTTKPIDFFPA